MAFLGFKGPSLKNPFKISWSPKNLGTMDLITAGTLLSGAPISTLFKDPALWASKLSTGNIAGNLGIQGLLKGNIDQKSIMTALPKLGAFAAATGMVGGEDGGVKAFDGMDPNSSEFARSGLNKLATGMMPLTLSEMLLYSNLQPQRQQALQEGIRESDPNRLLDQGGREAATMRGLARRQAGERGMDMVAGGVDPGVARSLVDSLLNNAAVQSNEAMVSANSRDERMKARQDQLDLMSPNAAMPSLNLVRSLLGDKISADTAAEDLAYRRNRERGPTALEQGLDIFSKLAPFLK